MKKDTYCSIIKASGIQKGDLVLVQYWMEENLSKDVEYLQAEIAAIGATPILMVQKLSMSQAINENITDTTYGDKYFSIIEKADVVIDLMERPIGLIRQPLEPEKMGFLGAYMQRLFQTCATKKKMLQITVPTDTMAKSMGMEGKDFAERMELAMNIDYEQLASQCEKKKKEVEAFKEVTIFTGEGKYELKLSLENREWKIDAGDGDLPCGEIFIPPVETKTNGMVYFDTVFVPDYTQNGKQIRYDKVVITIKDGVIVDTSHEELTRQLQEEGDNNRTICELGIGMNKGVTSLCGCPLLDEKMNGTFHLGVGENTMFGGENEADDHYDLIGTCEYEWK